MYQKVIWDYDTILEKMTKEELIELIQVSIDCEDTIEDNLIEYAEANEYYDTEPDPDYEYEEYRDGLMELADG